MRPPDQRGANPQARAGLGVSILLRSNRRGQGKTCPSIDVVSCVLREYPYQGTEADLDRLREKLRDKITARRRGQSTV